MGFRFERLQEQDILQLRDISDEFSNINSTKVKPFLEEKQNIALVAKLDDKIIGLLYGYALTDFEGGTSQFYIYSLDIHLEYQGRGYGSRFVQFAVEWANDNGFRECYVHANEDNTRACRVYEKVGMTFTNAREFSINFPDNE
ncbi:MAG: GNAT family N-acetyltransferase [Oscillospiraceae bacterium]|nr:GNAT family N-acetyltransferase [Oscillospiraceae bacterium]